MKVVIAVFSIGQHGKKNASFPSSHSCNNMEYLSVSQIHVSQTCEFIKISQLE